MDESISDQLMEVTKLLQEADARQLGEKGLTLKQVQVIAMMGQQTAVNPQLKQMMKYLSSMMQFDPDAEFN